MCVKDCPDTTYYTFSDFPWILKKCERGAEK